MKETLIVVSKDIVETEIIRNHSKQTREINRRVGHAPTLSWLPPSGYGHHLRAKCPTTVGRLCIGLTLEQP